MRQGDGRWPIIFNSAVEEATQKTELLKRSVKLGVDVNIMTYLVILVETTEDLIFLADNLID